MKQNDTIQAIPDTTLPARYAKAGIVSSSDRVGFLNDLTKIVDLIKNHEILNKLFMEPCLEKEDQLSLLAVITKDLGLQQSTKDFLILLMEEKRLPLLFKIYEKCQDIYAVWSASYPLQVVLCSKLEDAARLDFEKVLKMKFPNLGAITYEIDGSLLGGYKLFYKNTQYDFSLQGQLHKVAVCLSN